MANYPGVLGNTFTIGRNAQQPASGIDPYALQQIQQIQQGQAPQETPMDGLYEVEGMTKEYYDKWSSLNNFASEMYNRGINVTKPDPLNPESEAAFRWYQKAVADLRRHGNALKNAQTYAQDYLKAKLSEHGQNIGTVQGFDPRSQILTPFDVVNTGETDMAKRINTDLAKSTNDPAERRALQGQINDKVSGLKNELSELLLSGADQSAIEQKAAEIRSIQNATYNDTDRWKENQQNWRAKLGKEEKDDITRVKLVQEIKAGNYDALKALPNIKNVTRATTPRKDVLVVTMKDGSRKEVDLNSSRVDTGINEFLNTTGEGTAVSIDNYLKSQDKFEREGGILTSAIPVNNQDAEDRFIGILSVGGNSKQMAAAKTILEQGRAGFTVPAKLSGGNQEAYVESISYPSDGQVKLTLEKPEKGQRPPAVIFDLTTSKGKRQFQEFIDNNKEHIDYSAFKPKPDTVSNFPAAVGGTEVATSNPIDLL